MRRMPLGVVFVALAFGAATHAGAATLVFNAATPADNAATRDAWLTAIGTLAPEFAEDFEDGTKYMPGDSLNGVSGVLPGGLVSSSGGSGSFVSIITGAGSIGGSNPVDSQSLQLNEGDYNFLDFSANPVYYVAFVSIDHIGTTNGVVLTYVDNTTQAFSIDNTGSNGDTAEFYGIFSTDRGKIKSVRLAVGGLPFGLEGAQYGLDNLEYGSAVVPVPAAVWLFGSGLGVLGWLRRRAA